MLSECFGELHQVLTEAPHAWPRCRAAPFRLLVLVACRACCLSRLLLAVPAPRAHLQVRCGRTSKCAGPWAGRGWGRGKLRAAGRVLGLVRRGWLVGGLGPPGWRAALAPLAALPRCAFSPPRACRLPGLLLVEVVACCACAAGAPPSALRAHLQVRRPVGRQGLGQGEAAGGGSGPRVGPAGVAGWGARPARLARCARAAGRAAALRLFASSCLSLAPLTALRVCFAPALGRGRCVLAFAFNWFSFCFSFRFTNFLSQPRFHVDILSADHRRKDEIPPNAN